jgi:hypothetical protein
VKTLIAATLLALAAAPTLAASSSQQRMKDCSAEFKSSGKASGERQAFMKECLAAKKEAAAPAPAAAASAAPVSAKATQQNKMKSCSADFKASGKPSKERQGFMKECLKA